MRAMVILIPAPTGYGGVRHIPVSLPRIDCLVADMPGKYAAPESLPAPAERMRQRAAGRVGPAMIIPG